MNTSDMDRGVRQQYLQAMGIQDWQLRSVAQAMDESPVVDKMQETQQPQTPQSETIDKSPPEKVQTAAPVQTRSEPPLQIEEPPSWIQEGPLLDENFIPEDYPEEYEFEGEKPPMPPNPVANLDWPALEQYAGLCTACGLEKTRTNVVFGMGDRTADLMVIGEAPGAEEDRQGEPFVGRAGQLLNAMLLAIGLQREQVYIANILKCRPPQNRDPRAEEVVHCEPYLKRQLALVKPKVILAVGRVAAHNLLESQEAVGRLRAGQHYYDGIPLIVTYHPAYLLRSPHEKAKAWQDLQRTVGLLRS